MVYSVLCGGCRKGVDLFEDVIRERIAFLKNHVFEMTVTPGMKSQNAHVLIHWKHKLEKELGLDGLGYVPSMGTLGQDSFGGNDGNVLDAFYKKFTEGYILRELSETISRDGKMLNESGVFLMEDKVWADGYSYLEKLFLFKSEEDRGDFIYSGINSKGVEEILVKMKILVRNESV